jgi:hypothetical protein
MSAGPERDRAPQLSERRIGVGTVALVDDEDVGDFEESGFHRLDVVAETGRADNDTDVRHFGDVDLALAGADGFDEDHIEARGVKRINNPNGCWRQPAESASARD